MKDIFNNLNNRVKALYLLWVFLNFILFLLGGSIGSEYPFDSNFFPFYSKYRGPRLSDYDYSEFILYSILPIVFYIFLKLWNKDKNNLPPKNSTIITQSTFFDTVMSKKDAPPNQEEMSKISVTSQNILDLNNKYLSNDTVIKVRLVYFFYLIIWAIFITQFSYERTFGMVGEVLGNLMYAWGLALIIGLFRIIRKLKPTKVLYIFHFIWATILAFYALYFNIKVAEYLNK